MSRSPSTERISWSVSAAKASGRYDGGLRYPGEDGGDEALKMDALGL